jgi:hypothetical protein
VNYTLVWNGEDPLCACEDFITADTELVSASAIRRSFPWRTDIPPLEHFLHCCRQLGIPDMEQSIHQMLTVDFLIANTDRHYNNFGAVRNPDTLAWLGAAPIFDSGTSLWYNQSSIDAELEVESKPFLSTHAEQIGLVTSFDWLDLSKLDGIGEELVEVLRKNPKIDEARCQMIRIAFEQQVERLAATINKKSHV